MATFTGYLRSFSLQTFASANPRIVFMPKHVATRGASLLATRRIIAIPDSAGMFTVTLSSSYAPSPPTPYTMRIEWQDPDFYGTDQGYIGADFPDMEIWADDVGGDLTDFITAGSHTPITWWSGTVAPPFTAPNLWWFNPETNDIRKWE